MRHTILGALVTLPLLGLLGCEAIAPTPVEELDLWKDASAGISDGRLALLARDVWEEHLAWDPFGATFLGDPRYNGEIPLTSKQARAGHRQRLAEFLARCRSIPTDELGDADRLTRELLLAQLEDGISLIDLGFEDWAVDPLAGPHIRIQSLAAVQPHRTQRERAQLVERWRKFQSFIRQAGINLQYGAARGKYASRTAIRKVIAQLDATLDGDPFESPLVSVAMGGGRWVELPPGGNVAELAHDYLGDARKQRELRLINLHLQDGERLAIGTKVLIPAADDPLSPTERGKFLNAVLLAVEEDLYPALAGYRDFLRDQILPRARPDTRPGLVNLSGGEEAYRTLIHHHTTLPLAECDARKIHEFGLAEVARIRSEISALGQKVLGTADVGAIQDELRHSPDLHFTTRDEVEAKAVSSLARANRAVPRFFGRLPRTPCEVVRIPAFEEKDSTIAYYREPAADGSRPGQYFINTFAPETRPRYEAEVLAYHEAVPGHHLQIALAQELEDLPLFRRNGGTTAFVEGWALYTERLCDEMGLYSSDLDRLGVLSFDAWRASRLVVDTGIHAFGWSRQQAIDYLLENTLLAPNNIANEVDRYIAWPGQALAYKIGQREILALRDEARGVQGSAFSYPEFHDVILGQGAVSLPALRGIVERWLGR
ncbi:MAG TPA: DUF885 domain-containing protein [Planctomycetes bacterium]|nr:DUF885 domain-containing protein [Planctomycetota bacterium]